MDFQYSKETIKIREEVRAFFDKEWPAENRNWRGWEQPTDDEFVKKAQVLTDKLAAKGWLAWSFPKEYGGHGRPLEEHYIIHQELLRAHGPNLKFGCCVLLGPIILKFGTEEQKKRFGTMLAQGKMDLCLGYTEPNAGSDLASLTLRAVREGDNYIINGQKIYTTNAHIVSHCFLLARTDPKLPKHKGLSLFVVDMKTPGISIRPIHCLGDVRTNETFWDNVKVPVADRLGDENMGWKYVTAALDSERIWVYNTTWVRTLYDDLVGYLKTAEHDGWKPREDPFIRNKMAQINIELEVCQILEYNMVYMMSHGKMPYAEASMLKVHATEMYQRMTDIMTQALGLYAQLQRGEPGAAVEGNLLDQHESSIGATFLGGASAIQRTIIANAGLQLPPAP
jgi:3-oxocholest-4-en-26-oyl-CoA dehydrogenase alpha subunit